MLNNTESKVAYLLQMIALELYKASKEIDPTVSLFESSSSSVLPDLFPQKVSNGPNDIKFHAVQTDKFFLTVPFDITIVQLGEFEDLYYATCAKLKELSHWVDVHLTNGFKSPSDTYFQYQCPRLEQLDPVSVGDFKASLLIYEIILNSSEIVEPLNKGVIKRIMRENRLDNRTQLDSARYATQNAPDGTCGHTEQHQNSRQEVFQTNLRWLTGIGGLQNMKNMSCSMIYGSLAEKHRPTIIGNESLGISINRQSTPDAPQVFREANVDKIYISPYNLEERAKKLNAPGGPEMPCICDPDCICAPVCASDLTQNCLCEENGLFARVTQGMDIDDLDVPDLVRPDREGSETSRSSVVSLLPDITTIRESPTDGFYYSPVDVAFDNEQDAIKEIRKQQRQLEYQLSNDTESEDAFPAYESFASPYLFDSDFWVRENMAPPRVSSLAYREALLRPFAKECEYPPRRASIARRLFFSRSNTLRESKKLPNGGETKVSKQGKKRSLAEISFNGLKLALRRNVHMGSTAAGC